MKRCSVTVTTSPTNTVTVITIFLTGNTRQRLIKGLYDYDKLVKGTPFDVYAKYRREPETTDPVKKPNYKKTKAKWNTN